MISRILIVDDEPDMCEVIAARLRREKLDVQWVTSGEDALAALKACSFDVVLTDVKMPRMNGIELCQQVVRYFPDVPVIVMTAFGSLETAVAAIRAGAYDFVTKPVEMDLLTVALKRAVQQRTLEQQVKRLNVTVERSQPFESLIGESPVMRQLFDQLRRIADTDATVLLTGESGTGKELVARALHERGSRKGKPFLAVNCSALPESLLESELFGHEKGAFTDASSAREGLFVQADGGTLLLDEIGDLPLSLQPKLLRALEERRVKPIGGNHERPFDVRLIATTNQDLETAKDEGRFRDDLYYRLHVIPIELPPLRSRGTDVLLIASHFTKQFAERFGKQVTGIADSAAKLLLGYDWPGNVRELRNAIERAVALTQYDKITTEDLTERIRDFHGPRLFIAGTDPSELLSLQEIERRYILHVLKTVGGNRAMAARVLQVARRTLYRKLEDYGVSGQPQSTGDSE